MRCHLFPCVLPLFSLSPGWICLCAITLPLRVHLGWFIGEHSVYYPSFDFSCVSCASVALILASSLLLHGKYCGLRVYLVAKHLQDHCCCGVRPLLARIVCSTAFTSSSRISEGTLPLSLDNRPQVFQVSSLVMIFTLKSAALALRESLVTGAWYPISKCGDNDIFPLSSWFPLALLYPPLLL